MPDAAHVYSLISSLGTFWITVGLDGRWHVILDGENLGAFLTAEQAAGALVAGKCARMNRARAIFLKVPLSLEGWFDHGPPLKPRE